MHILDDVTLIQQFISGEATLAANQKLRIEPAFNSVQLLAKRGGLIATTKRIGSRQTVLLRQASDYSTIVRQILRTRQFVPVLDAGDQPGFEQYRTDEIPVGYAANHTPAKAMWKEWWRTARHSGQGLQMDILIFARDTWYPVRNIVCSQGVLFITTLVSEIALESHEQLSWLHRLSPSRTGGAEPLVAPALPRSLPPASTTPPDTLPKERHIASKTPDFLSKRETSDSGTRSDLKQVLRFRQGKLYITTALGDVVVEGSHLTFRLDDGPLALDSQQPIDLDGYRDRESRVAKQSR
jgi:hypothetical protein